MKRAVLSLLLCAGCAYTPVLVPDARAQRLGDKVAYTRSAGVQLWINGDAWRGDPYDLPELLTPVHVVIQNDSGRALRLSYRDFALAGASGMRYTALAPLQGQQSQVPVGERDRSTVNGARLVLAAHRATAVRVRVAPRFHHQRFFIAPHYGYYYQGYPLWGYPFPYDPYLNGPYSWPRSLPSDDMLAEAIPEGVLEPGGRVDGFVYFQGVSNREDAVRFELSLVDAQTGAAFARASVPMRVELR